MSKVTKHEPIMSIKSSAVCNTSVYIKHLSLTILSTVCTTCKDATLYVCCHSTHKWFQHGLLAVCDKHIKRLGKVSSVLVN